MVVCTLQDKKTADFQILVPKEKRGLDDDYYSSSNSRKVSAINLKLPHCGNAAGINYEVKEIDNKEILSIRNFKMKIDQVGLLQDILSAAYSKTMPEKSQDVEVEAEPLVSPTSQDGGKTKAVGSTTTLLEQDLFYSNRASVSLSYKADRTYSLVDEI